jgi:hypothetical protein
MSVGWQIYHQLMVQDVDLLLLVHYARVPSRLLASFH